MKLKPRANRPISELCSAAVERTSKLPSRTAFAAASNSSSGEKMRDFITRSRPKVTASAPRSVKTSIALSHPIKPERRSSRANTKTSTSSTKPPIFLMKRCRAASSSMPFRASGRISDENRSATMLYMPRIGSAGSFGTLERSPGLVRRSQNSSTALRVLASRSSCVS